MNATEHLAAAERYLADAPTQTTPDVEALHVQYAQTHFLGAIANVLGANDEPLLEQLRDAMPAPVVLTDEQYNLLCHPRPEATCGAVSGIGVRCSEPDGHDGFHKGKSVDDHGGPVFSRWSNTKTTPTSTRQDLADLRAKLAAPRTEPKWNVGGPIIPQPEAAVYVHQETNHG